MVKVAYIANPLTRDDIIRKDYEAPVKLSDIIPATGDYIVAVNGTKITSYDMVLPDGSQVVYMPKIEKHAVDDVLGFAAAALVAVFAPAAGGAIAAALGVTSTIGTAIITAGVVIGGMAVLNALMPAQLPTMGKMEAESFDASPTYSWNGIASVSQIGRPIPVLYGQYITGGNVYLLEKIYPGSQSDPSAEWLHIEQVLCEGEINPIHAADIYINNIPATHLNDLAIFSRTGTLDQDAFRPPNLEIQAKHAVLFFTGVRGVHPQFSTNYPYSDQGYVHQTPVGSEVKNGSPVSVTTQSDNVNTLVLGISLPHGLFYANDKGGLDTREVELKIEYREVGGTTWTALEEYRRDVVGTEYLWLCTPDGGDIYYWSSTQYIYSETQPDTNCEKATRDYFGRKAKRPKYATTYFDTVKISAATIKPIKKEFTLYVPAGKRYEVRVTKITADANSSREQNVVQFDWLTEKYEIGLSHPGIAKLKIMARADSQLNGSLSSIKTLVSRKAIPVYRPDGSFYGNMSSSNPAWAAWDLLTNVRYGAGISYSQIDFDRFVEFAAWCDDEVRFTFESKQWKTKRATFNAIIDFRSDLWTLLQKIMGVGHATPVIRGTKFSLIIDKPADPVQLFSMGNIVAGSLQTTYAGKEDVPDIIAVKYYDANNFYQPSTIEYSEKPDGFKVQEVNAWGIIDAPQAWRYGRYLYRSTKYLRRVVEFDVGIDALACEVGDVVMFAHDVPAWGHSGRLLGDNTTTVVHLDEPVLIDPSKSYNIIVRMQDDTIEQRAIDTSQFSSPTKTTTLTVTTAFSKAPDEYALYTFGEVNKEYKLLRVINISRTLENNFHIVASDYRADILEEEDYIMPEQPIADLTVPEIVSADIKEYLVKRQDGTIVSMVDLFWSADTDVDYLVNIYYRLQGSQELNQIATGISGKSYTFDAWFLEEGKTYEFFIRPVMTGREIVTHNEPDVTHTYLGKSAPPSDVASLDYEIDPQNGVILKWPSVSDVDVAGYNIYINDKLVFEKVAGNRLLVGFPPASATKYAIRAVDTTNHVSVNETAITVTFTKPVINSVTYKIVGDKLEISAADVTQGDFNLKRYLWVVDDEVLHERGQTIRITPTETTVDVKVTVFDVAGFFGQTTSSYTITLPEVTDVAVAPENGKLRVTITGVTQGDFQIAKYVFSVNSQTVETKDTTTLFSINAAGDYSITVTAIDVAGFSSAANSQTYTVTAPSIKSVTLTIDDVYYVFTPSIVKGTFEVVYIDVINTTTNQRWTIEPNSEFRVAPHQNGDENYNFIAYDKAGIASATYSVTTSYNVPVITNAGYKFAGSKLILSWGIEKGSFSVAHYELHVDNEILTVQGTTFTTDVNWLGSKTFTIVPVDVFGFAAGGTDVVVNVSPPAAPQLEGVIDDTVLRLSWNNPATTLDIDHFVLRYDNTEIVTASHAYSIPVTWKTQTFYIRAVDVAGNSSDETIFVHNVTLPTVTKVDYQIIDNNVILKWFADEGALPIKTYRIKRGPNESTAEIIGTKKGTFTVIFETHGGTYTYWVCPIDAAGNEGQCAKTTVTVSSPPDYVLNTIWVSDFSGEKENAYYSPFTNQLYAPVNVNQTYQQHFDSHNWTAPQDQVNAGYPLWSQPYETTATYTEVFDYGTTLSSSMITIDVTIGDYVGSAVELSYDIAVSQDGSNWTIHEGAQSVYETNFRYVRITVHFNSDDDKSVIALKTLSVKLDSKRKRDSGMVTVNADDTNGTWVSFNESFTDVESITLTPQSTDNLTAVYDFDDVPNPAGFSVYLFDQNGNRVSGKVSWQAVGY